MKENFTIHNLITFIAAVSFFAPLGVLVYKKISKHPFFSWFAFYWAFCGLINLFFLSEWVTNQSHLTIMSDVSNCLDALLMLFLLYITQGITKIRKKALYIFGVFAALSVVAFIILGFNESLVYVLGVGLALILVQLLSVIVYYLTSNNRLSVGSSRLLLYYALLFEYGTSIITFATSYVFPNLSIQQDSFLLYHVSIIISTILGCFAIGFSTRKGASKRVHTLQVEKEVEIQFL